jgi:hypothetical protein
MVFYGFYCIVTFPQTRGLVSIIVGIVGFIPFLVHKVFVNKKEYFNKIISNIIIFGNTFFGIGSIIIGIIETRK